MNKVDGAKRVSKIPHPILNVFKPKSKTHHKTLESKFRARLSTADDPWASDKRRWHGLPGRPDIDREADLP